MKNFFFIIVISVSVLINQLECVDTEKTNNKNDRLQSVLGDLLSIVRKASDVKFGDLSKILSSLRSGLMDNSVVNDSVEKDHHDDDEDEHHHDSEHHENMLKEKRDLIDDEVDDVVLLLRKALKNLLDDSPSKSSTTKKIEVSTKKPQLKATKAPNTNLQATESIVPENIFENNKPSLSDQINNSKFVKILKLTLNTLLSDTHIDENQKVFKD
ncbi:unnamed protein product [Brachionus calyciflorus]|uniref:Uncharacterized protein n=1 Tax=Brachionus calyciflorus TaxID=104777 RepID=A0A813LVW9_9BILA|nr:unnamed protein product [Brachionus calyciflorus]